MNLLIMAANSGNRRWHFWAGKYGNCGHIYSPGGQTGPIIYSITDQSDVLPYGLDNGAWAAFDAGREWDEGAFYKLLDWAGKAEMDPLWIAAPDVITKKVETLKLWDGWAEEIRSRGFKAALVAQDGMTPADIRAAEPDVVFLGGSTTWKWLWLHRICDAHPRVHVGRVNGYNPLLRCYHAGAESCDGTGWFRGDQGQLEMLRRFLDEQASGTLPLDDTLFSTPQKATT